ncbi:mucin-13-like [Rhinatrema bivittatum]|uniref:mucin-13-like n=1 Tax=Rhinatrema bivittatum TaxID=194408 RepID=UPI0011274F7D|nr:mucin-13-like [Rhinatrema bivittatum]
MRGAASALGCLCLLLLLPDVRGADGVVTTLAAVGEVPSSSGSTGMRENATTEETKAGNNTTVLATAATSSEHTTEPSRENSSKKSQTSSVIPGSQAAFATSIALPAGAESPTPNPKSSSMPSTVWVSVASRNTTKQLPPAGGRTEISEGGASISGVTAEVSTTSPGGQGTATTLQSPMTSGAKGVTGQTVTIGADTSTGSNVTSLNAGTQAPAGGTAHESSDASSWTSTGHPATSLPASEPTGAGNETSTGDTVTSATARHSTNAESETAARDTAASTSSLAITKPQSTTPVGSTTAGGSLLSMSSISSAGSSSASSAKSTSAQPVSPGNSTGRITATPAQESSTTTTTAAAPTDFCKNVTCPNFSSCISGLSSYICRCPLGWYFQAPAACVTGRTFQGSLHLQSLSYTPEMANPDSLAFKTTAASIERVLSEILKNHSGFVQSIVVKLTSGSVIATMNNLFSQSSPVTGEDVTGAIQRFISECRDCWPLQKGDSFQETSICGPDSCDVNTTTCRASNGEFTCTCKDGYFKLFPSDRSCMACSSGYGLQNTKCVACPFGYGGFNCTDSSLLALVVVSCVLGSLLLILLLVVFIMCCRSKKAPSTPAYEQETYLRWPKQEALKIPRVTMSWDSGQMEMQENGSRSNLMEKTVGNGIVVDDKGMDSLRTFTCKSPTRYSYLCQGQENPYFISDDHAQVNPK